VADIFAHKVYQYCDYSLMLLRSRVIMQDAGPEIVDAPLTLISMMGRGPCNMPCYLLRLPIHINKK
jgi:hypothetical protein